MKKNCRLSIAVRRSRSLIVLLLLIIVDSLTAQQITLKTGQKVETQAIRRDGDIIMGKVQVGTGSGEIGYNLAQIARIDFPEPRGLKNSSELLAQGQPEKALA